MKVCPIAKYLGGIMNMREFIAKIVKTVIPMTWEQKCKNNMYKQNKTNPLFDIDNYINKLEQTIKQQEYIIQSLKTEIRTQRKEIAGLREERRHFLKDDQAPNFDYDLFK